MNINRAYHEQTISQYAQALLETRDKKTYPNIAKTLNRSHDEIYRFIDNASQSIDLIQEKLVFLAKTELTEGATYFLGDDSFFEKMFSNEIEGVELGFDGSTKQILKGMRFVTALLTDAIKKIPIYADIVVSKLLGGAHYKSKSDILREIFLWTVKKIKIDRVIADAHYISAVFFQEIIDLGSNFLMKISRSRRVTINRKTGQLRNLLKLEKNSHSKTMAGEFQGVWCFFHVVKIDKNKTSYFITNDEISAIELMKLYKVRWDIETFYSVGKQHLGMGECQSRSSKKQLAHVMQCMSAFAYADLVRVKHRLPNIQSAIRFIRTQKPIKIFDDLLNDRGFYAFA